MTEVGVIAPKEVIELLQKQFGMLNEYQQTLEKLQREHQKLRDAATTPTYYTIPAFAEKMKKPNGKTYSADAVRRWCGPGGTLNEATVYIEGTAMLETPLAYEILRDTNKPFQIK